MQLNRDNRFGYGLCGGAGLAFLFGQQRRYEFSVEARYGFGYGDILRNGTKYKGNPDRSPLDNINVFAPHSTTDWVKRASVRPRAQRPSNAWNRKPHAIRCDA
ncbi:MAG: hypothetical protein ACLR8Y_04730 [Alistipes indistinctus]